jgi:hypothetical protein
MFTSTRITEQPLRVHELEERLTAIESQIATLRAEQVVLVNELDRAQAPQVDASRSMVEWVQSHLDIRADLAGDLVFAARTIGRHRAISGRLATGSCTFDRAVATTRYAVAGATPRDVEDSFSLDLHGVRRLTASSRRMTRRDERELFDERFFTSQVSLDHSHYRFWGQLSGVQGRTLEKAMFDRADELRRESPDVISSRTQRQADAVVAMAQDSLDRSIPANGDPESGWDEDQGLGRRASLGAPQVSIFVDCSDEVGGHDTTGDAITAAIAFGPHVGPDTLEAVLCTGRVRVIGMADGEPVATSRASHSIPPAVREAVLHRDGGCTIDGCRSRYRLEPHHIHPRSRGGSHEMGNLTTLCWYHHHVAIHGSGYRIDPDSPATRRRLTRGPHAGVDPPHLAC